VDGRSRGIGVSSQGICQLMPALKRPDFRITAACDPNRRSDDYDEWFPHELRDIQQALELAEGIEQEQRRIAEEVRHLGEGGGEGKAERLERLDERKDALAGEVKALEEHLDRRSRETRRTAKEASRELGEAVRTIRENKLKEEIRYSKGVVRGAPPEAAEQFEETIGSDIEALVAETLEDLKMFEYALRREFEGTDVEKLRLSGSAEVPEGWRRLVEEYYRSLSREGS
jgi:hypothetical protein